MQLPDHGINVRQTQIRLQYMFLVVAFWNFLETVVQYAEYYYQNKTGEMNNQYTLAVAILDHISEVFIL